MVDSDKVIAEHRRLNSKGEYSIEITHYLTTLKRKPGACQAYEKMGDKSKDEFLEEILKAEIESRNNSAIVKKIKRAGFPTLKRFEELKVEYLPEDAQRRIEELKSLEFKEEHGHNNESYLFRLDKDLS